MAKTKLLKVIIAGTRSITDFDLVVRAINASGFSKEIGEVVCGDAKGVDSLGALWASHWNIPVKHFPADWKNLKAKGAVVRSNRYGQYNANAGRARNEQMAKYADALIAVIKDGSAGTTHMIETMMALGKMVYVWEV